MATQATGSVDTGAVAPPESEPRVSARPRFALTRIALISDTHTTRGTTRDQPLYRIRLEKVIADVNAKRVDWVLIAGDLTQGGRAEEVSDFRERVKGFKAPVSYVYGNHDDGGKSRIKDGKKEGVTTERLEQIERELGPSFWAEERAGVRVLGINASLFGSGLPRENQQWAFLENRLARPAAGNAPGKPTLLLTHYPLFLRAFDEPGDEYWNIDPAPRTRLLALLKNGGVRAVLSGHLHRPLTIQHAGILHATTLPVSFGLPRGRQLQGWTLLTIQGQKEIQVAAQTIAD